MRLQPTRDSTVALYCIMATKWEAVFLILRTPGRQQSGGQSQVAGPIRGQAMSTRRRLEPWRTSLEAGRPGARRPSTLASSCWSLAAAWARACRRPWWWSRVRRFVSRMTSSSSSSCRICSPLRLRQFRAAICNREKIRLLPDKTDAVHCKKCSGRVTRCHVSRVTPLSAG